MSKASNLAGFASSISSNNNLNVGIVTASGFVGNLTGNATGLSGSPNVVLGITTVSAGSTSAPAITPSGDNNTGVFFPSADTIAFAEGGVEAARFDSSGRLLVGTSTARENTWNSTLSQSVQIEGTTSTGRSLGIFSSAASSDASYIVLAHQRSGSIGGNTVLQNNDDVGLISFQGSDGSEFVEAARIRAEVDGTPGANDMPGRLVFSTTADGAASPTERMRITSAGYFKASDNGTYVGSTGAYHEFNSSANNINLNISSTNTGASAYCVSTALPSGAAGRHYTGYVNNVIQFSVAANGNVTNTNGSYTSISDEKLKENIVDSNSQWEDIKSIKIRNWNFKVETGYETHKQIGPIAQELEEVCPNLVFELQDIDNDGNNLSTVTKGVNTSVLYMKAVKALQEAMERIETLEATNNDLLARVSALESK